MLQLRKGLCSHRLYPEVASSVRWCNQKGPQILSGIKMGLKRKQY